jgi:hypothetical protein
MGLNPSGTCPSSRTGTALIDTPSRPPYTGAHHAMDSRRRPLCRLVSLGSLSCSLSSSAPLIAEVQEHNPRNDAVRQTMDQVRQALHDWIMPLLVWSVVSFPLGVFLGLFLGHRLTLRRDRRREVVDLADRLFLRLESIEQFPDPSRHSLGRTAILLRRHLGRYRRWRYDRALARYNQATSRDNQERDTLGQVWYSDEAKVRQAARTLKKVLHRR